MKTTTTILAVLLTVLITACGPEAIGIGEGETSSETGETGDSSREHETTEETETGGETSADTGGDPAGEGSTGGSGDGDPGGDGRLLLVEFQCVDGVCQGRWDGTPLWSFVSDAAGVAAAVEIPPPWDCDHGIDVDVCIEVDLQGHVGCFWYQDEWAVAVAPSCAVSGAPWLDVGNDMRSAAT